MRQSIAPPSFEREPLIDALAKAYPLHEASTTGMQLLQELVEEYMRLCRLIANFPNRRIVATGPIMAVQFVHSADRQQYFDDCMDYFGKFIWRRDIAWRGTVDPEGAVDTCKAYAELYDTRLHPAWRDLAAFHNFEAARVSWVN